MLDLVSVSSENFVMQQPLEMEIVPTTAAHIRELQSTIRDADKNEIEIYGYSCAKGLWRSYKVGLMNKTCLLDGKVAACWGCGGTYMGAVGQPWLLTSYEIEKISPLKFARIYQKEVHGMLKIFSSLENFVAADYDKAIRLLQIAGFTIGQSEKIGQGMYKKFSLKVRQ